MTVNFEILDFIVSQLDKDQVTFRIPVFNDEDLTFAKMIQKRYQPDVLYLSAGNPEPHASGNIVEAQLNRLRQLWEQWQLTQNGKCASFATTAYITL